MKQTLEVHLSFLGLGFVAWGQPKTQCATVRRRHAIVRLAGHRAVKGRQTAPPHVQVGPQAHIEPNPASSGEQHWRQLRGAGAKRQVVSNGCCGR